LLQAGSLSASLKAMLDIVPRSICSGCSRPTVVCICASIRRVATQTRVVILQHPRESDVAINTAKLVELQLERAERHVAIKLSEAPALQARLHDPAAPAILLYPGPDARDLSEAPPSGPVTLVVLDGTWWQAKKLFQLNPELAQLPRYSLTPSSPRAIWTYSFKQRNNCRTNGGSEKRKPVARRLVLCHCPHSCELGTRLLLLRATALATTRLE
jgi:DTW domain-containing protein YfiP